jgi:hypothetical protein
VNEKLTLRQIGRAALNEVADLVGCPAEGVTGVQKDGNGWVVTVEVLEAGRVPETMDVLASYEVNVDPEGNVQGFRRRRRYLRAQVED